jgi:hypothetical protein
MDFNQISLKSKEHHSISIFIQNPMSFGQTVNNQSCSPPSATSPLTQPTGQMRTISPQSSPREPPHRANHAVTIGTARPHARWCGPPFEALSATWQQIPPHLQPLSDKPIPTGAPCAASPTRSPTPCRLDCPAVARPLASLSSNDNT